MYSDGAVQCVVMVRCDVCGVMCSDDVVPRVVMVRGYVFCLSSIYKDTFMDALIGTYCFVFAIHNHMYKK